MDASCVQRQQDIMASSQSLDSMLQVCTKPESQQQQQEKKPRPSEEALKCPRCDSSNTKFCYYNNYSLTQPRYFCKSCRRYWTKGGTLRNVPVGGGCRKNKRCSSSSSRRSTPDHLQSFITSPTSSSQQLISPLAAYEHYNNNDHNNNHPFSHHGNIPLLGNGGNTHFDLFGNQFNGNLFDSLRSGAVYHEGNNPQSNGVSLYYGDGGGNLEEGDHHGRANNNVNLNQEDHQMGMQFDLLQLQSHQEIMSNASSRSSTPTIKHELGDNRSPLFSYIMTGAGEIDTPRESWNDAGVLGSSWHNLLNSPLM